MLKWSCLEESYTVGYELIFVEIDFLLKVRVGDSQIIISHYDILCSVAFDVLVSVNIASI